MSKTASRRAVLPSFADLVTEIAAAQDLVPHYTELYDSDQQEAMREAYIREHLLDEARAELGTPEERDAHFEEIRRIVREMCDGTAPTDPAAFGEMLTLEESRTDTLHWIQEEIVYAIGVEIGRRLSDGGR